MLVGTCEAHILREDQVLVDGFFGQTYALEGFIGRGPRSQVYLATSSRSPERLAIKVSYLGSPLSSGESDAIMARLEKFHLLRHPAIVRLHDMGIDRQRGKSIHVMEYVDGCTLDKAVERESESLTIGAVVALLRQLAGGIDVMHDVGLVHRDIKPQNILVGHEGRVAKISDFGVALSSHESSQGGCEATQGTPCYVAPEQIIGANYGPSADIYSFAMTIYFVLTGRVAFKARSPREMLFAQVRETPIPLRVQNEAWPVDAESVLMSALSKDPGQRPATAAGMVERIEDALGPCTPLRLSSFHRGSLSSTSEDCLRKIP